MQASIDVSRIMGTDNDGKAISDTLTITGSNLDGYYITADKTTWNINNGSYLVKGNVTINGDVTVDGSVFIYLYDGATLTIKGSVKISGNRGLNIIGQSTGDNAGQMVVNNPDGNAFERLSGTYDTAAIIMYSGRLMATGKDRALGENVYLYKALSGNSTPIVCEADGRQVRATASKTNPDEAYWSSNNGGSAFSAKSFTLQWCNHTNEEWEYVSVDDTNHYRIREWCNWRDGGVNGVETHNLTKKPTADGKGHSGKCQCGYGRGQRGRDCGE